MQVHPLVMPAQRVDSFHLIPSCCNAQVVVMLAVCCSARYAAYAAAAHGINSERAAALQGMQLNPGCATIEGTLLSALCKAGAIESDKQEDFSRVRLGCFCTALKPVSTLLCGHCSGLIHRCNAIGLLQPPNLPDTAPTAPLLAPATTLHARCIRNGVASAGCCAASDCLALPVECCSCSLQLWRYAHVAV